MQLHYVTNKSHTRLEKDYFLPSLPEGLVPVEHVCSISNDSGTFMSSDFLEVIRWKIRQVLQSLDTNEVQVWSDVDIVFNSSHTRIVHELQGMVAGGKPPLAFQQEHAGNHRLINAGFVIIRPCPEVRNFYRIVDKLLSLSPNKHDQDIINDIFLGGEYLHSLYATLPPNLYAAESNRGLAPGSRIYHANCTGRVEDKYQLLEKARACFHSITPP